MYWRKRTSSKSRDYKKDISQLESLSALPLADLKKVQRYVVEYPARVTEVKAENAQIDKKNEMIDREYQIEEQRIRQEFESKQREMDRIREPISERQAQLKKYLLASTTWFSGFSAALDGRNCRIAHEAKPAYEEYLALERKWSDLGLNNRSYALPKKTPHIPKKKPPADYTVFRIAGASVRVFYDKFSLENINEEIKKREIELQKEKSKIEEIRARAATKENETRAQARKFRNEFESQLRLVSGCPYCEVALDLRNSHQDHIYPVSKGGLSTKKNLVFVCAGCNLKKKENTLRVFVRESGYNFEEIALRLEKLGKDF